MMNLPKISIIIPVYNAEKYLSTCLDSVLAQTFTDWECILVNDGSTDNSGKICEEYVVKDKRFRVVHKENGGVSSARNLGLDKVQGEWVYFSDSDDTLDLNALSILHANIHHNTILVMAGIKIYSEQGCLIESTTRKIEKVITIEEAIKQMYAPTDYSYQGYLVTKLFNIKLIKEKSLKFNEKIFFNEDRLYIVKYLCNAQGEVSYTTTSIYNYLYRESGAMMSLKKGYNKKFSTDFDAYVLMKNEIFSYTKDKKIRRLSMKGIVSSCIHNHALMVKFRDYDSKIHRNMVKQLIKTGAIKQYIVEAFRQKLKPLLLLLFPKIVIKFKR